MCAMAVPDISAAIGVVNANIVVPTSVVSGQATLTGAAQQLPNVAVQSVTIENPSGNNVVYVKGDNSITALNSYRLNAGASVSLDIDNVNRVWVLGTLNQTISYIGVV